MVEMKKYKLGDILELQRGYDLTSAEMKNANIPVAGSNGVIGYHDVAKCITPCITVGRSGSVGKVHFYRAPVWVHNTALYVSNFKGNDPKYLYYLLSVLKLDVLCGSSVVPSLNRNVVYPMEVPFCSDVGLQNKISSILSTLDQRIENLRAQNRVLEQTAKTIYDYTFLQCAGHQTTYNKTLNRNIPAGWEVSTIGCYIKESKGGDWGKENPEKNYNLQVSCVRGADIEKMTDLPIRYILAKNSSKLLQEFDLIVEISGGSPTQSTGRSRLMTKELLEMFDNKLICSNFCQAVTMKNPQYAYYISFMWKMFYDKGIFFNFEGKTSGIKNFQLDQFVDTMWFFPDLKTVEKFNAQVALLIKKQLFNAKQIEALTTQRNTLLPLLMTGKIEV